MIAAIIAYQAYGQEIEEEVEEIAEEEQDSDSDFEAQSSPYAYGNGGRLKEGVYPRYYPGSYQGGQNYVYSFRPGYSHQPDYYHLPNRDAHPGYFGGGSNHYPQIIHQPPLYNRFNHLPYPTWEYPYPSVYDPRYHP